MELNFRIVVLILDELRNVIIPNPSSNSISHFSDIMWCL